MFRPPFHIPLAVLFLALAAPAARADEPPPQLLHANLGMQTGEGGPWVAQQITVEDFIGVLRTDVPFAWEAGAGGAWVLRITGVLDALTHQRSHIALEFTPLDATDVVIDRGMVNDDQFDAAQMYALLASRIIAARDAHTPPPDPNAWRTRPDFQKLTPLQKLTATEAHYGTECADAREAAIMAAHDTPPPADPEQSPACIAARQAHLDYAAMLQQQKQQEAAAATARMKAEEAASRAAAAALTARIQAEQTTNIKAAEEARSAETVAAYARIRAEALSHGWKLAAASPYCRANHDPRVCVGQTP